MSRAPGEGLRLTREMAKVYGKRGGIARASVHRWHVEGENLTSDEIAKRIGTSHEAAYSRIRKLRLRGRVLTWSALRLEKQQ